MSGSIVKRGNGYAVVIELERDPVTGKRRQKWHSGFRTRKEAERARIELLGQVAHGTYVETTKQTVTQFMAEWLDTITPTVRASTLHSYRRNVDLHVLPHIGNAALQKVDAGTLNGLYARLLATGRADGAGGLSARSVRYVHTILHRAFKDAVRWERLMRNPADAATPPASSVARHEFRTWSNEQLGDFLRRSAASKDRYFATWVMLATTGLRRGEALGLRWSDVDLDGGTASIQQTVIAVKHAVEFGTPKTAKGRRRVNLDEGTVAILREHRTKQLEERLLMGAGWRDHDLVFCKPTGEPLHPERVSREFDRRIERWKLERIRLHDLRHTWATLALAKGTHPKVVQERLGHANSSITLDIYSHVTPTMQAEAAASVAADIFRASR